MSFFTSFPPTSLFCTLFDTLYSVFCTPLFLRLFRCLLLCFYRYTYSTFFDYHILGLLTLLIIFLSILLVLGENRLLSSKCNLLHPLFGIERVPCEDKWGKRFSPLRRRSESELHLRLTVFDCFGLKRIIHFHVQPYISTFRNRKGGQKIFAAQTPQRKRGYVEDFAMNMTFYPSNAFSKVTTCYYGASTQPTAKSPRDRRADGVGF